MKVCMIAGAYPPAVSGAARHVEELSNALADLGVEVHLVTATSAKPPPRPNLHFHNAALVRIRYPPYIQLQFWLWSRLLETRLKYQLAHIHSGDQFFIPKRPVPIVSTFHGVWKSFRLKIAQAQLKPTLADKFITSRLFNRYIKLEQKLLDVSQKIIVVSRSTIAELKQHYDLDPTKIVVIPNGANPQRFRPNFQKQRYFLFVGRQTAQKRIDLLLQAFSRAELPEWRLKIVGESPIRGVSGALRNLAKQLGIQHQVDFEGFVDFQKLVELYSNAYAFVTATAIETFPSVIMEAFASATPVIATDVGGHSEIITSGRNGILVPPQDPDALAKAMQQIASDPELQSKLAHEALETAQLLSWSSIARRTLEVYSQVLESS